MGDRKPLFSFKFWSSGTANSRRTRTAPPPATTTSSESQTVSRSIANTTNPAQKTPPSSQVRKTATTKTPSSSPSQASPSRKASQTRSPSRLTSPPPKQAPDKQLRSTTQEISASYEAPKPAPSQQQHLKADDAFNNNSTGTSFKDDEAEAVPSKSSELRATTIPAQAQETPLLTQKSDSFTISNLKANPEEIKQVKEVLPETNTNEETKKENDFLTSKSGSKPQITEKAEIPKPDQVHTKKQEALDTKEILPDSLPNEKPTNHPTSQPQNTSTIFDTHSQSALPRGKHVPLNKDIRDDISKFVNRVATGDPKSATHDRPVSVITLAGENRGASMQMGTNSPKRESSVHIHRSYKVKPDESAEATTDGEASSKGKKSEDAETTEDQPTEACVNNNTQGINNSIVFNASMTERNPGVHMVVTHVPMEAIQSTDKKFPVGTRMSEFNMARAQKLTYEPTVRRRCLRGLFLETSDSDPENPNKPPRHGCRVGCQQRDKENNIDVL